MDGKVKIEVGMKFRSPGGEELTVTRACHEWGRPDEWWMSNGCWLPGNFLRTECVLIASHATRVVGTYDLGLSERISKSSQATKDAVTGATARLLANLERERVPCRELPRVRDIYAPGRMLDE